MAEVQLRDYQSLALDRLRDGVRAGHRAQMLYIATGGGKTICAAKLLAEAERKMTKACFVVDRRAIVNQTSVTLDRYGIDHGIIMADHPRNKPWANIQIASAQTIEGRGFFPGLKLLIVDEAHSVRSVTARFIKNNPDVMVIGLSATPFTPSLAKLYTNVVSVKTTDELTQEGWLVPLKVYSAKAPDMTGAKIVAGEWSEDEIEERGSHIIGDIVSEWQEKTKLHFGRAVKTIVFSATVAHGEELCRQFNAAGYDFRQVSYKDGSNEHREALLREFGKPDSAITGLVSCEALSKGMDVVDILCGISARPYRKSLSSHIQQLGRVMRPAPGKDFALWLDHSGNYGRFYEDTMDVFSNGVSSLSEAAKHDSVARKEPTETEKKQRFCPACGYAMPPVAPSCPACGHERTRRSLVETLPGELVEFAPRKAKEEKPLPAWAGDKDRTWKQLCGYALQRKKGDPLAARKWANAQYKTLFGEWPRTAFMPDAPPHIDIDLRNRITYETIRWANSRRYAVKGEVRAMNLGKE